MIERTYGHATVFACAVHAKQSLIDAIFLFRDESVFVNAHLLNSEPLIRTIKINGNAGRGNALSSLANSIKEISRQ